MKNKYYLLALSVAIAAFFSSCNNHGVKKNEVDPGLGTPVKLTT